MAVISSTSREILAQLAGYRDLLQLDPSGRSIGRVASELRDIANDGVSRIDKMVTASDEICKRLQHGRSLAEARGRHVDGEAAATLNSIVSSAETIGALHEQDKSSEAVGICKQVVTRLEGNESLMLVSSPSLPGGHTVGLYAALVEAAKALLRALEAG